MVKTDCQAAAGFREFDVGFRCAQACDGCEEKAVVHLFGAGSFAPQETYDSKVLCGKCLPLEDAATVDGLAQEVISLRQHLAAVTSSMQELQTKVTSALQLRGGQTR
ncbi:unnamed protein product [Effrenium voratum]|nr:unnamed protein product [Effrenium voratum]